MATAVDTSIVDTPLYKEPLYVPQQFYFNRPSRRCPSLAEVLVLNREYGRALLKVLQAADVNAAEVRYSIDPTTGLPMPFLQKEDLQTMKLVLAGNEAGIAAGKALYFVENLIME